MSNTYVDATKEVIYPNPLGVDKYISPANVQGLFYS